MTEVGTKKFLDRFAAAEERLDNIEAAGGVPEEWHEVGAVGEPAFQNGYTNLAGAIAVGFRLDRGLVQLKGTLDSPGSAAGVAFTLPDGYRPDGGVHSAIGVDTPGGQDYGVLRIGSDGTVEPVNAAGSSGQVGLDGVAFPVA